MKRILTDGIILSRTNYGEADRILTILTPDQGKLRLGARGVRKVKSKLAGGIELFSTSHITYIEGKSEVGTLVSTRLIKHYGNIIQDIERVQVGYVLIKMLDKTTEDHPEPEYYELLKSSFAALNEVSISLDLIRCWFEAQLLRLAGHTPNLETDGSGNSLDPEARNTFDFESMAFIPGKGKYTSSHIKALRLIFSQYTPIELQKVRDLEDLLPELSGLVRTMLQAYLRIT